MTPLAVCTISHTDDTCIASVAGEVDSSNVAALEAQMIGGVRNDSLGLIIDLSDVTYLDSAGIRLLFAIRERLEHRRQRCLLAVPEDALIRRVLAVAHVETVIPVASTKEAAQAQLRQAIYAAALRGASTTAARGCIPSTAGSTRG